MSKGLALCCALAACGDLPPREVTGPATAPKPGAAEPPARIVAAERFAPGAHLVFVDENGLRVADLTEPPSEPHLDVTPAWSPDGTRVAFASSRGRDAPDHTSLWIVASDGKTAPTRLTTGDGVDLSPWFSPDGKRLVFASTRGGTWHLWTLELAPPGAEPRRLTDGAEEEFAPAWSHHGDRIAFTSATRGQKPRLRVMAATGGAAADAGEGSYPAFSPDDRRLVFVAAAPGRGDQDLWTCAADGSDRRRLVDDDSGDERAPRFSADGRFVLATTVIRGGARVLFSSLVVVDLQERPPRLRALTERLPVIRLGVDPSPRALDAGMLSHAPLLGDALRRTVPIRPD